MQWKILCGRWVGAPTKGWERGGTLFPKSSAKEKYKPLLYRRGVILSYSVVDVSFYFLPIGCDGTSLASCLLHSFLGYFFTKRPLLFRSSVCTSLTVSCSYILFFGYRSWVRYLLLLFRFPPTSRRWRFQPFGVSSLFSVLLIEVMRVIP